MTKDKTQTKLIVTTFAIEILQATESIEEMVVIATFNTRTQASLQTLLGSAKLPSEPRSGPTVHCNTNGLRIGRVDLRRAIASNGLVQHLNSDSPGTFTAEVPRKLSTDTPE
jgi:hypothetical protein